MLRARSAVAASSFPAPAISQGLMKWRMQTTWPKNFPGLGVGAKNLAKRINDLATRALERVETPRGTVSGATTRPDGSVEYLRDALAD